MKRFGWCYLFFTLTLFGCNQPALQVLRTSRKLTSSLGETWVKTIRTRSRSNQVHIIGRTGHHWWLPADSIWGYRTQDNKSFRLKDGTSYEVRQQGPLMVYLTQAWGTTSGDYHYFSLTPTSTIYNLNRRTCRQVFSQDDCMMELLNQLTNEQLLTTDSHGSYGLVNSYRFCQSEKK
ncbi:hypothetical protein CWM47_28040 [Spirosoma pollinicola]|uniref:Lipoprotein n=1 Tax=Spirosoma pollinicola TaxID=2057025 RepID=A0A2K8Z649_9BACT|nr:hypothetical protein CWM47_28040 [Spirosoma pollinicola]